LEFVKLGGGEAEEDWMQVSELTLRLPFGALGEDRREARGEEERGGGGTGEVMVTFLIILTYGFSLMTTMFTIFFAWAA
jgi:hypothetical protein